MSTRPEESDGALLRRLRLVLDEVDPVPPQVVEDARPLLALRRLDEELAELVRDSAEERGRLLTVRGEGDIRLISFETGPVTVELQVTERAGRRDLVAQVSGTVLARAEVETGGGRQQVAVEDSLFTLDGAPAGLLRLRLLTATGNDLVTSWVRI